MASGIQFDEKTSHFTAKYEHPWGGVASDAAPMDIAPNQAVVQNSLNIKDGVLCAYTYDDAPFLFQTSYTANARLIMFTFCINQQLYSIDNLGSIYGYETVPNLGWFLAASNSDCINASCVQVINGLAYIFSYYTGASYVFDPVALTLVLGSAFVGGLYCCTVDQYLLTANTNQPTDTPAVKPGRVNWSGPDEYTTWDPSVDRTSGYNVLTDVSDYISAIFSMGNIAYVLRSQGMTQLTPTGVGIAPFDFTTLWASEFGIGCTFPQSFAQYGPLAIWMNDTNIYSFAGSGMPQEITGSAKTAIFQDLAVAANYSVLGVTSFVMGCISGQSATPEITSPDLEYALAIVSLTNTNFKVVVWTFKINTKQWTRVQTSVPFVDSSFNTVTSTLSTSYIFASSPTVGYYFKAVPLLVVSQYSAEGPVGFSQVYLTKYQSQTGILIGNPNAKPAFSITFKQEEIKLTRQPQVRGVAIKATGVGTLTVTVSGQVNINNVSIPITVTFTPVVLNTTSLVTVSSSGVFTGEDPQLSISSSSFDGVIVKAAMFGTYADGEPF